MTELTAFWVDWLRPSAGLPTAQWSLLLPKVVGYSAVGAAAGLAGFSGAAWPLQGAGLFLRLLRETQGRERLLGETVRQAALRLRGNG